MQNMNIFISIVGAIVALLGVVLIHEWGHFIVARAVGVRVEKFSIGFGKAIWSHKSKSGTIYALGILPLGGYVKMYGEVPDSELTDTDKTKLSGAYHSKPLWARMAIVAAGPITNFLLAIVCFWVLFMLGVTYIKPVVGQVSSNSIAAKAGIQRGDEILKIANWRTDSWRQVILAMIAQMGKKDIVRASILPKQASQPIVRYLDITNWKLHSIKPDIFKSLGITPYVPTTLPVVADILKNSPAANSGLKVHDRIIAIGKHKINDWGDVIRFVQQRPNQRLHFKVLRNGRTYDIPMTLGQMHLDNKKVGYMGVMVNPPKWPPSMKRKLQYSFITAWNPAVAQTWFLTSFNYIVLKQIVLGRISYHTLGGPITIFKTAGKASVAGVKVYLWFVAFISLTLGFINLFPIPALDGGHILFHIIEGVIRRPIPARLQEIFTIIGFVFLIFIMLQATLNDILRLF